jgi:ankyrin repeat protein
MKDFSKENIIDKWLDKNGKKEIEKQVDNEYKEIMKDNPIQLEYLKSVLLAQLLLEANESLYFTTQYKQTIKNLINRLNKELEQIVFLEYKKVYNTDPEMTTNILRSIEDIVLKLQTSTIDELVMINTVIDKYKDNKEWFLEYGNAEFLRIDG